MNYDADNTEVWKDIPSYEGEFQASNMGRIKGLRRPIPTRGGIRYVKEKIRRLQYNGVGYLSVGLRKNESTRLVHRLIAEAFIDIIQGKEWVNHKNGIKTDNRVENLEWCTRQENEDHAFSTGLKNSTGSNNVMAVLSESEVISIREDGKSPHTLKYLSEKYRVSPETISRILRRKTWTHI